MGKEGRGKTSPRGHREPGEQCTPALPNPPPVEKKLTAETNSHALKVGENETIGGGSKENKRTVPKEKSGTVYTEKSKEELSTCLRNCKQKKLSKKVT